MERGKYLPGLLAGAGALIAFGWLVAPAQDRKGLGGALQSGFVAHERAAPAALAEPAIANVTDARARDVREASAVESEPRASDPGLDPVASAAQELATQVEDSLDGILHVNHLLDQLQQFALLPVDTNVDLEHASDDAVAYRMLGTPPGTLGRFLVGRQRVEVAGRDLLYMQMEVQMAANEAPAFHRDALRYGPRVHVTVGYDEGGEPASIACILQKKVALKESRKQGIDAYHGRYTSGAGFRCDLGEGKDCFSETFGLVNGKVVQGAEFQGISPLQGDMNLDRDRMRTLLGAMLMNRSTVDGSSRVRDGAR